MTSITLVITRKDGGGLEIQPRDWNETTSKLNAPVHLKQHDRIEIHTAETLQVEPQTMRKHLTATHYNGEALYTTEKD